jgi:sulfite reductase beta subunit-like hemoprotein
MVRIRVPGGAMPLARWKDAGTLAARAGAGFFHVTTRQDLQVHDIPTERVAGFLAECTAAEMPFRGGGGNTFRNIIACPHSGFSPDSVFDVQPFVTELNDFLMRYEPAFALPRKFKAGVFCCETERLTALTQDLGLTAVLHRGEPGFCVFGGGGMGRESMTGIELSPFVPVTDALACVVAMIDLFHDHGDRSDRNAARLRFVLKRMGPRSFAEEFHRYFAKAKTRIPQLPPGLAGISNDAHGATELLRFHPPDGNLSLADADALTSFAETHGVSSFRFGWDQTIGIPSVSEVDSGSLRQNVKDLFDPKLEGRIRRLFTTCIGARVCRIGLLDPAPVVEATVRELLPLFAEMPTDAAVRFLDRSRDSIRISGCRNSCAAQRKSPLGLQGAPVKCGERSAKGFQLSLCRSPHCGSELGETREDWTIDLEGTSVMIRELFRRCLLDHDASSEGLAFFLERNGISAVGLRG